MNFELKFTFVYYVSTLALTAFDGAGCLQLNLGGNAEYALQAVCQFLLQFVDGGRRVERGGEIFLSQFHLYL